MARSKEVIPWSLFGAGGTIAAFAIPAMIFVTGIAGAAGWVTADRLRSLLTPWPIRAAIFLVSFFVFFHCAHRLKFTLASLFRIHALKTGGGWLFYLAAAAGSAFAGWVLWRL